MKLVEGIYRPTAIGPGEDENRGKTGGLLLCLTKPQLGTEKVCVLDSGFFLI
jgi:hypothetical protein